MHNQEFELNPSKIYLAFISSILLISFIIVVYLPLEAGSKLCLVLLLIGYGVYILWHHGLLRSRQSIIRIKRTSDGRWLLQTRMKVYEGELCGISTVTSLISILRFNIPGQFWFKSCVILPDSLKADHYRQLLIVLRMF